jgi:hypothetical protein
MPDNQISPKDFAAKIKSKYPQYKDVDDVELSKKIIEKYPQYKSIVFFGEETKTQPKEQPSKEQPPKEKAEPSMFLAVPSEYTALGKGKTEDQKPLKIDTRPTKEPLAKEGTYVRPDIAPLPPSKDVTKAVEETTNKRLRAKYTGGILFPKNSNAYKKEYNDVLKSYNNGVLVYEDGNLKQGTGFFESLGDSIIEKGKREVNSYKINNVATSSELADILDDEREKQIMSTETEKTTKGVAGWVGKTLGEVGSVVGTSMAGTALAGGSPIGGIAAITLDTYYNTKAQKIKDIYYKELDRLEGEGVKREDARIKAAEIAQSQSSLAAVPETLAMAGMAVLPGASPTATAARKAFVELIKKPLSVGGIFALKVPAEKGIEELQGRKAEWNKLTDEMIKGGAEGITMEIGFKIVGSPLHVSKTLKSTALHYLSKMPDDVVKAQATAQEGGDKVLAQIDAYKQADKKIGDSVTEDLQVSVTGKQVAIDKLTKEIEKQKVDKVPDALIKENELRLEALKKQQNDIIETGNVKDNEVNNITGEPIGEKTLNDKRQEQYDVLADLASKNPNFKFTETFEEFNKNIDANPNYLSEVYDKSAPYVITGELKEIGGTKEAFINYLTEKPTEATTTPVTPTEVTTTTEITPIENPKVVITGTTRGMKVLESNTEFSDIKDARGEGRVFDENGILTESDGKGNTIVNVKVDGIDSLGREGYLQTSIIVPEGTKINEGSIKKIVDAQIEKIKSKDNKFLELDKIQKSDFTALKDAVVNELKNPSIKPTEAEAIQPEGVAKVEDTIIIDGVEYTFEEAIGKARSNKPFGSRMEYKGSNKQAKEFVENYNKDTSPYKADGSLKGSYINEQLRKALNELPFKKFADLYRKHFDKNFTNKKDLASYTVGDSSYDYAESDAQFKAFAKDAGIEIPKKEIQVEDTTQQTITEVENIINTFQQSVSGYAEEDVLTSGQKKSITQKANNAGKKLKSILGFDTGNLPSHTKEQSEARKNIQYLSSESRKFETIKDLFDQYTQDKLNNKETDLTKAIDNLYKFKKETDAHVDALNQTIKNTEYEQQARNLGLREEPTGGTTAEVPTEPTGEIISDADITTAESKLGGTESARKQYDADQQGFMGELGETYEQFLRRKLC